MSIWSWRGVLVGYGTSLEFRALMTTTVDTLSEMHWFHSKETFLLTYKHKLQHVKGEKFWKIDPSQAMKPPELVIQVGRPKVKMRHLRGRDNWAVLEKVEWFIVAIMESQITMPEKKEVGKCGYLKENRSSLRRAYLMKMMMVQLRKPLIYQHHTVTKLWPYSGVYANRSSIHPHNLTWKVKAAMTINQL